MLWKWMGFSLTFINISQSALHSSCVTWDHYKVRPSRRCSMCIRRVFQFVLLLLGVKTFDARSVSRLSHHHNFPFHVALHLLPIFTQRLFTTGKKIDSSNARQWQQQSCCGFPLFTTFLLEFQTSTLCLKIPKKFSLLSSRAALLCKPLVIRFCPLKFFSDFFRLFYTVNIQNLKASEKNFKG